eukprot:TRINITY_DN12158_c0_g1_i2.p1 TRINITY_DN12158_c0_g1~~TRINITY_DN12158_c0_g1_i2.p1  ORF type:complete len:593 (-),score=84.80 TRINITY_DN12158_c0_g1_i2:227-1900(-)
MSESGSDNPTGSVTAANTTFDLWFDFVDTDRDGRVMGNDAVSFFQRSQLPRDVLAKVWSLADSQRKGYLNRGEFNKAMELISIGQSGQAINIETYMKVQSLPGGVPVPSMKGMDIAEETTQQYTSTNGNTNDTNPPYEPKQQSFQQTPNPPQPSKRLKKQTTKKYVSMKQVTSVTDGLKQLYYTRIKPLEEAYKFGNFYSPYLEPGDFDAKPQVLLLGQYSTGKTTFIKFLLGQDYPGMHIGPEPTTDRFIVVMHGHEERRTPGNTLAVQPDKPYKGLSIFGSGFLGRFEGSECPCRLLEDITIIDTPGVLSGEKQRIERQYDFISVCGWFAARADLILLLFDPYKLDISDEFKSVIGTLKGHDDKVRIVLNKSDQVEQQQLMRVYGALMWSLGKVFRTPEVVRVYMGSFNAGKPIRDDINPFSRNLFESEQQDLLNDLYEMPHRSCDRKVNEFVKRVRAARIHSLLMGRLRNEMPMFGKQKAQEKILANLDKHFLAVQQEFHLPPGDFPDLNRFREILKTFDLSSFPKLDKKSIKCLEDTLSEEIPALLKRFENPF